MYISYFTSEDGTLRAAASISVVCFECFFFVLRHLIDKGGICVEKVFDLHLGIVDLSDHFVKLLSKSILSQERYLPRVFSFIESSS